jgi:hypothetical protein
VPVGAGLARCSVANADKSLAAPSSGAVALVHLNGQRCVVAGSRKRVKSACKPHERLFRAAEINRLHGRRLADDDAARVVARCALALAPGDERPVKRAARRLALRPAVNWTLVVRELFPDARPSPLRRSGSCPAAQRSRMTKAGSR